MTAVTTTPRERAIEDYLRDNIRLLHDAEEAKRLGDLAWERYCRWAAVVAHVAMMDEKVDREPDGLGELS